MPHFQSGLKLAAVLVLAAPAMAAAQGRADDSPRAAQFEALVACRALADTTQRLACFDAAAAQLAEAEKSGEIVVVSRAQAQAARRQAFGFSLPSLSIFDRTGRPEEVDRLTAQVDRAYQNSNGKWVVVLSDGAVWEQIDSESVPRSPRSGSKAEIRKAALGSFFMNLDGQRAVRARRVK
ncbi:hypothetical protein [Phenylobacterium sp.]|jgi:hypothetical protein|uniref:hypothetical protein n=1 Tax=Phenylobacterium sp. TaxID=1871053 RepID=UPI002E3186B9|nr:hypothetical protein [Phenylobacterium sp.]HEX2559711.1 hypothetical protein [Phenylobacterium sp.]